MLLKLTYFHFSKIISRIVIPIEKRVVLNIQTYEWKKINAGVPQVLVLGLFYSLFTEGFS